MGELTFFVLFSQNMLRLARVATDFYFIQFYRKGIKEQERPLKKDFWVRGVIIQREGVSTLCIHGYPRALNLLAHFFENLLFSVCVICFENVLVKLPM